MHRTSECKPKRDQKTSSMSRLAISAMTFASLLVSQVLYLQQVKAESALRPNIVVILADDKY